MSKKFKGFITKVDNTTSKNERKKLKKEKKYGISEVAEAEIKMESQQKEIKNLEEETTIKIDDYDSPSQKFDKNKKIYIVVTPKRRFLVDDKKEIANYLNDDEETYEVMYVQYIGYYIGKTDVICVTQGNVREFQTLNDLNSMFVYRQNDNLKYSWHLIPVNTLEIIYEKFKEKGIVMRNDIYKRDKLFREVVEKQIKEMR